MHALADKQKTALLLTASTGCAMTVLDTNVVGIILPTIARDLNASFADMEWVVSSYVLFFATLLLPAGALADRFGRKRILLAGIAVFTAASLACGFAPTAAALYIARAIQGIGAAALLAPALAIIGHAFRTPDERARAWAIWGSIMGLTMVLSPIAGGVINTYLGWRWAFHLNVPVCALLAAAVVRTITDSRNPDASTLDYPGMLLFVCAMFSLTWALILAPVHGWINDVVLLRAFFGGALFILFLLVERYRKNPMLDLALFTSAPFVGAFIAMFAYAASAQVMASLLPLFLQNARGQTALTAGLAMLPFALAMLLLPHAGRRLAHYLPAFHILTLGLVIVMSGNFLLAVAATTTDTTLLIAAMAILGSGGGLLNGETQKAIMSTIPQQRSGMGSGISTTSRFTGILLGFAGLGGIVAAGIQTEAIRAMALSGTPIAPGFIARVVAGDIAQATSLYPPEMASTLISLVRHSYGVGFSQAFMVAGLVAGIAAVIVFCTMRHQRA
jgi:EmrB/QacA subfamily drug resistance transporter